jgi:hypothetical protein
VTYVIPAVTLPCASTVFQRRTDPLRHQGTTLAEHTTLFGGNSAADRAHKWRAPPCLLHPQTAGAERCAANS